MELAALSDPTLVPRAVASALGVREAPDLSLTEVLADHLKPKETFLVLDNCAHLMEGCVALADTLPRDCPDLGHPGGVRPPFARSPSSATQGNERLLAGLVAALIAWRTRSVLLTLGGGMATLWTLQTIGQSL